jgi:serine/threonine protein kinase/WD40 repeat protein
MSDPGEHEVAIFGTALQLPPGQRPAYLDEACGGDGILRQRVEAFLADHMQAGDFLNNPAPGAQRLSAAALPADPKATLHRAPAPSEKAGDHIGRYKLLQQIGEGGCGVVYMAEQEEPVRRKVAVKVIKLGMDTKSVIARFEAERQALAMMDHANIAKVLDAGATETGRPYFVMELVRGTKITDYCDANNLPTNERLKLFIQVCQAIQHAHQKGIIHRDIKPSNILVTVNDGVPIPKVIDFGIAKATQGRLTDMTLFTAFEQFIGTPAYMSPEQAVMTSLDIDTRSDIYSLGVLLYELLTGKTPFDTQELMHTGLDEMRRTILEKEPARPSTRLNRMAEPELTSVAKRRQTEAPKLIHTLRGDLDWIVMKALEKDRSRRYETPNGLARDVQRYLTDEPVVARPPGKFYLFQKLVRRNKLAFVAAVVVIASLIIGLSVATVAVFRIKRAKDDATEKLRVSCLAEARALRTGGRAGQRFASLDAVRKAAAIRPDLAARNEAIACLALSDLRVSKQVSLNGHEANDLVCYDSNLKTYAVGEEDGSITVRTVTNDRALAVLPAPGFNLRWIRGFSPDSRYLRARYKDEREGYSDWVWNIDQQKPVLKELQGRLGDDFSSDSQFFARCHPDGSLSIYDLGSGKELKRISGTQRFNHLVFSPGNTRLACSSENNSKVEIRELESGRKVLALECPAPVTAAAWSPDGKHLATACLDCRIYVWDAENGRPQATLAGHDQYIIQLAYNHAGNLLASASYENLFRLWNPYTGRQIASYPGAGLFFQFSPDDRYLGVRQEGAQYGLLEVTSGRECRMLHAPRLGSDNSGPEFSADGHILAAGTGDRVSFWDVFSGEEIASLLLEGCDTHIFHPDGHTMIVIDRSGGVRLRSLERAGGPDSSAYLLGKPRKFYDAQMLREAALSRDGRHLAVTHEPEGESFIFDLEDPSAKVVLRGHPFVDYIAISPDGHWAATGSWHNSFVKVWDARSGDLVRTLPMPARTRITFSPDGRWLVTSTIKYQLWEVGSWQPKGPPIPGNAVAAFNCTAFTPDGRIMAIITEGRNIELLETLTANPLATLEAPGSSGIAKLQFSPDGSLLAASGYGQQLQLWDLRLIRQELTQLHLDWDMPPYPQPSKTAPTGPVTLQVESDASSQTPAQ